MPGDLGDRGPWGEIGIVATCSNPHVAVQVSIVEELGTGTLMWSQGCGIPGSSISRNPLVALALGCHPHGRPHLGDPSTSTYVLGWDFDLDF